MEEEEIGGGIFDDDDNDDAFWASEDEEGFTDSEDDQAQESSLNNNNSRVIESKMTGNRKLVCVITNNGPQVARATVDEFGEVSLEEEYRDPTQEELARLNKNGQIVKLGPQHQAGQIAQSFGDGSATKKIAFGVGLLALAGGGLFLYNKYKSKSVEDDDDDEIDNED